MESKPIRSTVTNSNDSSKKSSKLATFTQYLPKYAIAIVACAIAAITLDFAAYLLLGPTSANTWYNKYWIVYFFCFGFIVSSFIILKNYFAEKPEIIYLIVVLTITTFMAWSLSTYIVGWDTGIHFQFVLGWADLYGQFELSKSELAFSLANLIDDKGNGFPINLSGIHAMEVWINNNDKLPAETLKTFSLFNAITEINYIPPAIAMSICEALNLPFTVKYFLSLLPCIFIYSFVTYFGMKKLKSGKMLYAIIAMFPTSIFLTANYGYQYWNISFFLYGFACLAGFIQTKEPASLRQIIFMLLSLIVASLPRLSYAPLILLALMVPRKCFSSKKLSKAYRFSIVGATILAASIFIVPILFNGLGTGDLRGGTEINPTNQLESILSSPLRFMKRLFFFFAPPYLTTLSPNTYANDVISGFLTPSGSIRFIGFYGYLGYLSKPLFYSILVLLAFTTITDKNYYAKYKRYIPIICTAMTFFIAVGITTYMYMIFNNVGEDAFRGMQSRYLLPLVFPTLIFLGSYKWGLNGSAISAKFYNAGILGIMTLVLFVGWWQTYLIKIY